jgi:23S rRNA pseudouridine2605 synthase
MLVPACEVCYQPLIDEDAMARKSDEEDRPERGERIAKAIARAGLASRREAEGWIAAGRVAVNGEPIAEPGRTVTPADRITVDGAPLPARERTRLFLYHKPRGLVTTHADPEGRPTIFAALPKDLPRLLSVGRLDISTEGLLLLTNDGGLARVLELPQTGWLRRYRVRALGRVTQPDLDRLRDGVTVDGMEYGPIEATLDREQGSNVWLTFAIREGKNREVRNVLGHLGLQVNRLIRVSFGPFQLGELVEGAVEEVRTRVLRDQLGARVVAEAKCDFSGPIVPREAETEPAESAAPRRDRARRRDDDHQSDRRDRHDRKRGERRDDDRRPDRRDRHDGARGERRRDGRRDQRERPAGDDKPAGRPRRGHAWRAEDAPLRRHYRGGDERGRPDADASGPKRAGLLTDRKGRRVLVERFGEKKPREDARGHGKKRFGGRPPKGRNRRRPDRARGPRPSRPKE